MPTIAEAAQTAISAGIDGSTVRIALERAGEIAGDLDRAHLEGRTALPMFVVCAQLRGAVADAEQMMREGDAEGAALELARAAALALVGATMGCVGEGLGWSEQWEMLGSAG